MSLLTRGTNATCQQTMRKIPMVRGLERSRTCVSETRDDRSLSAAARHFSLAVLRLLQCTPVAPSDIPGELRADPIWVPRRTAIVETPE